MDVALTDRTNQCEIQVKIAAIRDAAEELLSTANVQTPPVPVERLARQVAAEVRYEPFDGELSGMLLREEGRAIIGVNALHSKARQRFTIAHELGHLILHDHADIHLDRWFRIPIRLRDERSSQAVDVEEIDANRFAAEVLMPAAMVEDDVLGYAFDYDDDDLTRKLADRYRVSIQAMAFRLLNLGLQE